MRLWAYKQDNTIPGCGEPSCCGATIEEIDWSFHLSIKPMTADEFIAEYGGGPVLEIRQATEAESVGYWAGFEAGSESGWKDHERWLQEKQETEIQENLHERTNNPRNGDAVIPEMAKSARTHEL